MMATDWSLILFTVCLQAAVGIFAVSRLVIGNRPEREDRTPFLLTVGLLTVIGAIASLFHLGSPGVAYLVLTNLGTSWLSREILFTILFGSAWLISLTLEWRAIGSPGARNSWHAVTAVLGLGLVYVMSMAYRTTFFPSWAHMSTTVSFFVTTGLLGTATTFGWQLLQKRTEPEPRALTGLMLAAVTLLGLQLITITTHLAYLASAGVEAQASATLLFSNWLPVLWLRIAMLVAGTAVLMVWGWRQWSTTPKLGALVPVATAAVVLIGLGELLGRVLFYATRVQIGL